MAISSFVLLPRGLLKPYRQPILLYRVWITVFLRLMERFDLSYRVASRLGDPGIVAHGVALKPGKPICLAVSHGKPVVILPGFPTSAIFTFHEFVAPVLRTLGGRGPETRVEIDGPMERS